MINPEKYVLPIAVIVAAIVLAISIASHTSITGQATYGNKMSSLVFPVTAYGVEPGWSDCSHQFAKLEYIDAYCKSKGMAGAATSKPCYYETKNDRWSWDGKTPMEQGVQSETGIALTVVKCRDTAIGTDTSEVLATLNKCEVKPISGATCDDTCGEQICILGDSKDGIASCSKLAEKCVCC